MRVYNGSAWQDQAASPDTIAERSFSATAGQTSYTFTGGYRVGYTYVYVNGALLAEADITATDGTTITFTSALALNDEVRILSYKAIGSVAIGDISGLQTALDAKAPLANPVFTGNAGLGVTPAAWNTITALQVKNGSFGGYSSTAYMGTNWYYASGDKYITSTGAALYAADGNLSSHTFYTAAGGTAGNAITWTQSLQFAKGATLALEGATSQTGVGITFPATQSASSNANTLDDYEEGTWTPYLTGSGTPGTWTPSYNTGTYTKIGNQVFVQGIIGGTLSGATGTIYLGGFPFNASGSWNTLSVTEYRYIAQGSRTGVTGIELSSGAAYGAIYLSGSSTSEVALAPADWSSGGTSIMWFSGCYKTS